MRLRLLSLILLALPVLCVGFEDPIPPFGSQTKTIETKKEHTLQVTETLTKEEREKRAKDLVNVRKKFADQILRNYNRSDDAKPENFGARILSMHRRLETISIFKRSHFLNYPENYDRSDAINEKIRSLVLKHYFETKAVTIDPNKPQLDLTGSSPTGYSLSRATDEQKKKSASIEWVLIHESDLILSPKISSDERELIKNELLNLFREIDELALYHRMEDYQTSLIP